MSYRLILLGLLAEQPRYGYELKQTIESRSYAQYIRLSGGGLYYHLRKLQEAEYIEEQTVEREGNYPDRHVYSITEHGRTYFRRLLRETFHDLESRRFYDPLDAAFAFGTALPRDEIIARLQRQLAYLRPVEVELALLDSLETRLRYLDLYTRLIVNHNLARLRGEIAWMAAAIQRISQAEAGELRHPDALLPQRQAASAVWNQAQERQHVAQAAYSRRIEDAWRDCERGTAAAVGDPAAAQRVRAAYEQALATAWQEYERFIAQETANATEQIARLPRS